MHGVQIPPDGADGQPSLLPQGDNQADDVDPQTLLAQCHVVRCRSGRPVASAPGTDAGDIDVLGNLHRNLGQVNDFPSALGPTAGQPGPAVGALIHRVFYPLGGRHAGPGKAVGPRLAWRFGLGRLPVGFGFQTGHPTRAPGFGLPFQLGNPLLQALDDGLLPDDAGDEDIPVGSGEVDFPIHIRYMT